MVISISIQNIFKRCSKSASCASKIPECYLSTGKSREVRFGHPRHTACATNCVDK
jgi:hypothetical protein